MLAVVLALVLAMTSPANAESKFRSKVEKPSTWVCVLVRQQLRDVYHGNVADAEKGARERGYTDQQIRAGRLCL